MAYRAPGWLRLMLALMPALPVASACGSNAPAPASCPTGSEQCACTSGKGCDPGFVCYSAHCVRDPSDAQSGAGDTTAASGAGGAPAGDSPARGGASSAGAPTGAGTSGTSMQACGSAKQGYACKTSNECDCGLACLYDPITQGEYCLRPEPTDQASCAAAGGFWAGVPASCRLPCDPVLKCPPGYPIDPGTCSGFCKKAPVCTAGCGGTCGGFGYPMEYCSEGLACIADCTTSTAKSVCWAGGTCELPCSTAASCPPWLPFCKDNMPASAQKTCH
jgi:hypothetical protein